jgi:hypothetical protein
LALMSHPHWYLLQLSSFSAYTTCHILHSVTAFCFTLCISTRMCFLRIGFLLV